MGITSYALPADLAPSLAEKCLALLAELSPAVHPSLTPDAIYNRAVCVVCHQGGKLGGHHAEDGSIEWIHHGCHRKLHRRGGRPTGKARARLDERRRATAR